MFGKGMSWWLGETGDGGSLEVGADATVAGNDFEAHLDASVFGAADVLANGITKGSIIDTDATTYSMKTEGGDTRREILDTLCEAAPAGPNFWRLNADFTLDADNEAAIWPTKTTPTTILTPLGGREIGMYGIQADLDLEALTGEEVRTGVYVDWNDGVNNGVAATTLPSTWVTPEGATPRVRALIDWKPKRPRPPTERWRRLAVWGINSQARADGVAAKEVAERTNVRPEITADLNDVYDPWRFTITPGNTVYCYDPDQDLTDITNEVYYRGETTHPAEGRVEEMRTPIQDGYGVYFQYWDGAAIAYLRLTEWVEFEEGPTSLKINHRDRFQGVRVRRHRITASVRRGWYRSARLAKFLSGIN
jgi:hypothetical protein